jgi:hypothetical protein
LAFLVSPPFFRAYPNHDGDTQPFMFIYVLLGFKLYLESLLT